VQEAVSAVTLSCYGVSDNTDLVHTDFKKLIAVRTATTLMPRPVYLRQPPTWCAA
jgi:hypothetical protein